MDKNPIRDSFSDLYKNINQILNKSSTGQKILLMIMTPIILLIIFNAIAIQFDSGVDAFDFDFEMEYVWWVWLCYAITVSYAEYLIIGSFENEKAN